MSFESKGRQNVYTCHTCGSHIVTVDLETGVTPFLIPCRRYSNNKECWGDMMSSMYRVDPALQNVPATHEWYRPTMTEVQEMFTDTRLLRAVLDHVDRGGLLLRPIVKVD